MLAVGDLLDRWDQVGHPMTGYYVLAIREEEVDLLSLGNGAKHTLSREVVYLLLRRGRGGGAVSFAFACEET